MRSELRKGHSGSHGKGSWEEGDFVLPLVLVIYTQFTLPLQRNLHVLGNPQGFLPVVCISNFNLFRLEWACKAH